MKIKEIEDPKIQQMAVVNTIVQHPEYELGFIMENELSKLFLWTTTQQGYSFWWDLDMGNPVTYTDKGLYFKNEFGDILLSEKEILSDVGFTLATPEEVFKQLNPKNMEHEPMTMLESDNDILRIQVAELKAANNALVKENSSITLERDELNKLIDEIEYRIKSVMILEEDLDNVINIIHNYRNPSLVGTTQTIEIDGKKYEVTINKQI